MKGQPNRLGADRQHPLQGSALDRSRPLQFRLDGRIVHGFAGDTVLSAVLASGLDTLGRRDGAMLALSSRHAPTISLAALAANPTQALPMERTPATDGAEYVTRAAKAARGLVDRLLRRSPRSLGLDLDQAEAMARPWLGMAGEDGPEADLVVVGGGIAGLSAALAGAKAGLRVVVAEASPLLGGRARFFGSQDGEESPDQAISRLTAAVGSSDAITVLTAAEVFALRPGVARLHQVQLLDGRPTARVLDIRARHIVLATGSLERLPIFPGNRLPGVSGALEAFELAQRYGLWPGATALLITSSSPAYRLAMQATDAGVAVTRIIDPRPNPQSRFIEFSKAYGITLAAGTIVASAVPAAKGPGLAITPKLALEGFSRIEPALAADRLVVCGGWQPDLTLWHMAGGESSWRADHSRLEPGNGPAGIALAGSAAGWLSGRACLASGSDAVDALLQRERRPIQDVLIDPIYETPDAPAHVGDEPEEAAQPAFLDGGQRYIQRPRRIPSRWPDWLPFVHRQAGWSLGDTPQPLDIADIAAGVQLGAIPSASAGIVAQERVAMVMIGQEMRAPIGAPSSPLPLPPPFLEGRIGDAELWLVAPDEARALDVGALIFANADQTDPLQSIGVIARIIDGKAIALVRGVAGQRASLREPGRAVAIRLVAVYRVGMDLATALGGGASTP